MSTLSGVAARLSERVQNSPGSLGGRAGGLVLAAWAARRPQPELPTFGDAAVRVVIGPANWAGQGRAWADAWSRLPSVRAFNLAAQVGRFGFGSDIEVDAPVFNFGAAWQGRLAAFLHEATHVVVEAGRALLGRRSGFDAFTEAGALHRDGACVALVFHGSELRSPRGSLDRERWSPYRELNGVERFVRESDRNRNAARDSGLPIYVSTPDLLLDLPEATWLPVVVDMERWAFRRPALAGGTARVVHVPSSSRLKGTHLIAEAMESAAARGSFDYVVAEGVPASEMPLLYREADIVLDQFMAGSYGVAACEAMAAGRIVVGHVSDQVRAHVRDATGLELPIVEADVENVAEVVTQIVAEPDSWRGTAARGPEFVRAVHDGRLSAEVARDFLDVTG